ncbi:hypothetical protein Pelo_14326 [Pelomyxa schiedti]|nr:hypothetical protein Pelo_14326 [Pelomyxa schiedti]
MPHEHERKSHATAWCLWCGCWCGFCGLHRMYLGKPCTGLLWFFTGGMCGVGQLLDAFFLEGMVERENIRWVHPETHVTTTQVVMNMGPPPGTVPMAYPPPTTYGMPQPMMTMQPQMYQQQQMQMAQQQQMQMAQAQQHMQMQMANQALPPGQIVYQTQPGYPPQAQPMTMPMTMAVQQQQPPQPGVPIMPQLPNMPPMPQLQGPMPPMPPQPVTMSNVPGPIGPYPPPPISAPTQQFPSSAVPPGKPIHD